MKIQKIQKIQTRGKIDFNLPRKRSKIKAAFRQIEIYFDLPAGAFATIKEVAENKALIHT